MILVAVLLPEKTWYSTTVYSSSAREELRLTRAAYQPDVRSVGLAFEIVMGDCQVGEGERLGDKKGPSSTSTSGSAISGISDTGISDNDISREEPKLFEEESFLRRGGVLGGNGGGPLGLLGEVSPTLSELMDPRRDDGGVMRTLRGVTGDRAGLRSLSGLWGGLPTSSEEEGDGERLGRLGAKNEPLLEGRGAAS